MKFRRITILTSLVQIYVARGVMATFRSTVVRGFFVFLIFCTTGNVLSKNLEFIVPDEQVPSTLDCEVMRQSYSFIWSQFANLIKSSGIGESVESTSDEKDLVQLFVKFSETEKIDGGLRFLSARDNPGVFPSDSQGLASKYKTWGYIGAQIYINTDQFGNRSGSPLTSKLRFVEAAQLLTLALREHHSVYQDLDLTRIMMILAETVWSDLAALSLVSYDRPDIALIFWSTAQETNLYSLDSKSVTNLRQLVEGQLLCPSDYSKSRGNVVFVSPVWHLGEWKEEENLQTVNFGSEIEYRCYHRENMSIKYSASLSGTLPFQTKPRWQGNPKESMVLYYNAVKFKVTDVRVVGE